MPAAESEVEAVRRQLERVLASPGFSRNERMSRFLRFVVDQHLAGKDKEALLPVLKEAAPELRHLVSKRVKLRYTPRLHFSLDESFDAAQRIETILRSPEVARDFGDRNEND